MDSMKGKCAYGNLVEIDKESIKGSAKVVKVEVE